MHILYVAQRVPHPPTRGDKIATSHQIRYLAQRHDVSVACLADDDADLDHATTLARDVCPVDVVPLNHRRAHVRASLAPARRHPLTRAYLDEPRLHRLITTRIQARPVDAVIVYSSGMAHYVEGLTQPVRIMQFADLDSQKWRQYAADSRPPRRWMYAWEARRLLQYERQLAYSFDHSVVVSQAELEDFTRLIPGAPVSCVPNGVDLEYFKPIPTAVKRARSLVFVGVMDYRPNEQAVVWLCHEVLPKLRDRWPDVSFTICGARPSPAVQALAAIPGVLVTGAVADVRPWLSDAEVCVAPLLMGRGLQNKVLEALAMGLPTVATPAAIAGLNGQAGGAVLVGADAETFAGHVSACFHSAPLRAALAASGRALVVRHFGWEPTLAALERLILESVDRRLSGERRRENQAER